MGVLHNFSFLPQNIGCHAVVTQRQLFWRTLSVASPTYHRHTATAERSSGIASKNGKELGKQSVSEPHEGLIGRIFGRSLYDWRQELSREVRGAVETTDDSMSLSTVGW